MVQSLVPTKLQEMRQWLKWEQSQPYPPPPTERKYLCEICPQKEKCQSFFWLGLLKVILCMPN